MNEQNEQFHEPWESTYRTGATNPPKSRRGCIAVLLAAVILLTGLVTLLGIANIRLFRQVTSSRGNNGPNIYSNDASTAATFHSSTEPSTASEEELLEAPTSPQSVETATGGMSLQAIYEKAIGSVVSVSCRLTNGAGSTGTGVVLTQDGYIVTNCHVIEGAAAISVMLTDERVLAAELVGKDTVSDLAVLRVKADDLLPIELGDSSALRVGDTVVAIGDPLGVELRGTMTDGIVSAINRNVSVNGRIMTLIHTNAALNSGNSGGPLINCYGQVIGINTMKIGIFADSAGVEGIAFAIPSTTVKDVAEQLILQGYVAGRPTLGITGEEVSSIHQFYYRMPAGLYINHVEPGSDAYAKGVDTGDILISINDIRITSMDGLNAVLYNLNVGDKVEAVIYRAGTQYLLELTVQEDKN